MQKYLQELEGVLVGVASQRVVMEQVRVDPLVQLPQLQLQLWLWSRLRSSAATLAACADAVPRLIAQELQSPVERPHSRTPTHQRWHLTASESACERLLRLPAVSMALRSIRSLVRSPFSLCN